MNAGKPTVSPSRNPNQARRALLSNNPSFGQDARPLLGAFLRVKSRLLVVRRSVVGEQAKFLEIIDQAASTNLEKCGEIAVASGGTTDVWRGMLNNNQVALKAFRIYLPHDLREAKKMLCKPASIWGGLVHENVLPFRGVDTSVFQLALVYDWCDSGNIMQYLESHPDASKQKLLLQVAKGLQCLHSRDVIHGDLKGANVVISETGAAQVCDYGLTPITSNPAFAAVTTPGVAGSPQWLAPEIIGRETSSKQKAASKPADVFAFAMLAVQVFSGKDPFPDMTNAAVVVQILGGKRPVKPPTAEQLGLTTEMWGFIEKCWSANPSERPTVDEVVRTWEGFVNGDNNHIHVSKTTGRQTQFVESPNSYPEKHMPSPRKARFFCLPTC